MAKKKQITEFNNSTLDTCRSAIQAKLDELKDELGIVVKMGNISYGADSFTSKITTTIDGGADVYEVEYNRFVSFGGVSEGLVGLEFNKGAKLFKFRGVQPRARKSPYLAEDTANGKLYKFEKDDIMKWLKASNPTVEVQQ